MHPPRPLLTVITDVVLVLAFVMIGRASHHAGGGLAGVSGLAGIASTAWPFLTGLAAGELAVRSWRRPVALVPTGVVVWLGTVAIGMTLRVIAGQGTAVAFIAVALGFLGLFLLGWRAAAQVAARVTTRAGAAPRT
jgi:hypothetical protein